jgi:hypothetical protein
MTDSENPPIDVEELRTLSDMYVQALNFEEPARSEHIETVQELAGHVTLQELIDIRLLDEELKAADEAQKIADDYIIRAKLLANGEQSRDDDSEPDETTTHSINFDKIGWISRSGNEEVEAMLMEYEGNPYKVVNLIGLSNTTKKLYEKLESQSSVGESNLGKKLIKEVEEDVIPQVDDGLKFGRGGLRIVTSGGNSKAPASKSLNTTYTGFKQDVQGTKNRAILLRVDEAGSDIPAYAIAALYDHDDDQKIHSALFNKQK